MDLLVSIYSYYRTNQSVKSRMSVVDKIFTPAIISNQYHFQKYCMEKVKHAGFP